MEFTYTEKNGDKPIEEWLISSIKDHAKQKYGLNLDVRIEKKETDSKEASA